MTIVPKLLSSLLLSPSDLQLGENEWGRKRENDGVPDYKGFARMSGRRVEAILFSAGQSRRILTYGLSSLRPRVRR